MCSVSNTYVDESNKYEDGLTYKSAGVDIDAGSELVKRIAKMAPGIGGFGGLFPFGKCFSLFFTCQTCLCALLTEFYYVFNFFRIVVLEIYPYQNH